MEQPYYTYSSNNFSQKPRIAGSGRDTVFAVLFFIGCVMAVDFGLLGGINLGHTICAFYLTIVYFAYGKGKKKSLYATVCLALALVSSVVFALYPDSGLHFCLYIMFFILLAVAIAEFYDVKRFSGGSFRTIADWCYIIFVCPFKFIGSAFLALFSKPKKDGQGRAGGILLGLLCALPVIFVVVPLLIHADAAFEQFFSFISLKNILRLAFSVFVGTILFVFLFSHAFGTSHYKTLEHRPAPLVRSHHVSVAALLSFTGAISFFYLLYLISQITYFFGAFWGKLPDNFLPAVYARRGFFEMCIICMINLAIIFFVVLLSKREGGKVQRPVALMSGFMTLFSLLLIATALSKMALYIQRFGMTHLRIETAAFMIVLAFLFIALLIRLFARKFPYMKMAVLTTALITVSLGFVNIDTVIARYNISAYQSEQLSVLDTDQLEQLNSSAVPYIFDLLEDKDSDIVLWAKEELSARYNCLEKEESFDLRSYNFTEAKAEKMLRDNKAAYYSVQTDRDDL